MPTVLLWKALSSSIFVRISSFPSFHGRGPIIIFLLTLIWEGFLLAARDPDAIFFPVPSIFVKNVIHSFGAITLS